MKHAARCRCRRVESFQPCEQNNYSDPFHGLPGILDTEERFHTQSVSLIRFVRGRSEASCTAADDPRGSADGMGEGPSVKIADSRFPVCCLRPQSFRKPHSVVTVALVSLKINAPGSIGKALYRTHENKDPTKIKLHQPKHYYSYLASFHRAERFCVEAKGFFI